MQLRTSSFLQSFFLLRYLPLSLSPIAYQSCFELIISIHPNLEHDFYSKESYPINGSLVSSKFSLSILFLWNSGYEMLSL